MTVEKCNTVAVQNTYPYFGLEGGNQCFLGNSLPTEGLASTGSCTLPCTGAPVNETCGGVNSRSVYKVASSGTPIDTTGVGEGLVLAGGLLVAVILLPIACCVGIIIFIVCMCVQSSKNNRGPQQVVMSPVPVMQAPQPYYGNPASPSYGYPAQYGQYPPKRAPGPYNQQQPAPVASGVAVNMPPQSQYPTSTTGYAPNTQGSGVASPAKVLF